MAKKRIIPCLDIKDGRVVKGVNFVNLKDAGDPVETAIEYNELGADELVLLDITAAQENRKTLLELVKKISAQLYISLTVGGGIKTAADIDLILKAGADKVSINSAAVKNPDLIKKGALNFGSQAIVAAVDAAKKTNEAVWEVFIEGGTKKTGIDLIEWVKKLEELGAGEILLTSINSDGTKAGFDLKMLQAVTEAVNIPVIASGGAGTIQHFKDLFKETGADAALAASVFHFGEIKIKDLKAELEKAEL